MRLIKFLLPFVLIILLPLTFGTVANYAYTNESSLCTSGIARIVWSSYGHVQCLPSNQSMQLVPTLKTTQGSEETTTSVEPISVAVLNAQLSQALTATDWTKPQDYFWDVTFNGDQINHKVQGVIYWNLAIKGYITALLTLILELVKLTFYIVEMLFVIYILFTLIPEQFFKIRDSLVSSYMRRNVR